MRRRRRGDSDGAAARQSIGRGAFRLPDGSVAYTAKRAAAEYKKLSPVAYTAADVILLLLSSQDRPVVGRTLLFKELFLFEKEALDGENVEDCGFVPHYYGPYSFYLGCKIREMARRGLIEISGSGAASTYALTPRGLEKARKRRRTVPAGLADRMGTLRRGMDEHGVAHVLKDTRLGDEYAEYALKSRAAHRYKAITWGRGV